METLSHRIQKACQLKRWKPITIERTGPAISHVFFADDLLLMGAASPKQASIMQEVLSRFCQESGQRVHNTKSRVWFSPNTASQVMKQLSRTIAMPITSDLGIYLGVPIHHSRIRKHDYEYLIAKIRNKLGSWKGKLHSRGARALLIRTVTASIPLYAMQTSLIPKGVLLELEKINRAFLWRAAMSPPCMVCGMQTETVWGLRFSKSTPAECCVLGPIVLAVTPFP